MDRFLMVGQRFNLTLDYFKEMAFKSGIEAGYSKYHYSNKPINPLKLILRAVVLGMYCLAYKIAALFPIRSRIKHEVTASYYKARGLYEIKLSMNLILLLLLRKSTSSIHSNGEIVYLQK
ncbi:MAG: hypothetical protein NUV74_09465 [Candidatus Brocadiaceae bacterium]|nr:hypothetical protein [Candidatus Brocadiaceae bacterium]